MPDPSSAKRKPPPKQARSEAKRSAILDKAERLLSDHAPSEISTRLIADKADIPVGSIYRYFENADDLLRALFDRMNAETIQSLHQTVAEAEPDWRIHVSWAFRHLRAMHASHPAYGTLNRYLDQPEDATIVGLLDTLMEQGFPEMNAWHREDIARTVLAIIDGVERRLNDLPQDRRNAALEEAQIAVTAYLAHYRDKI